MPTNANFQITLKKSKQHIKQRWISLTPLSSSAHPVACTRKGMVSSYPSTNELWQKHNTVLGLLNKCKRTNCYLAIAIDNSCPIECSCSWIDCKNRSSRREILGIRRIVSLRKRNNSWQWYSILSESSNEVKNRFSC